MRLIFSIITVSIVYLGCKAPVSKSQSSWEVITIVLDDHQVINIDNYDDTSTVKNYDSGSILTGFHKANVDSSKVYFTMAEKDSIHHMAQLIISNAVDPKRSCTDFVGDLKLDIDYGTLGEPGTRRQSIEYSGICDWSKLSVETAKLQSILQRRIKVIKELRSHAED